MNRLMLIGNGFDLAHGLRTSYNNFIVWYLKRAYCSCLKDDGYQDNLITIRNQYSKHYNINDEFIDKRIDQLYIESKLNLLGSSQGLGYYMNGITFDLFIVDKCSSLLTNLLNKCNEVKWVDIENEFYKELKTLLYSKGLDEVKLKGLNDNLADLIKNLHLYLESLPYPPYLSMYHDILSSAITGADFSSTEYAGTYEYPRRTMALNFNYTTTVEQYISKLRVTRPDINFEVNYIHGRIGDSKNPLVFGFGDELDSAYKEMEQQPLNGFFEYIKSFWYSNTLNYREILHFVGSGPYQIIILGQSCGLSDRTLLSMLLAHPYCKSVKVYYHGDANHNNFNDITHQLGRQFNDKIDMRNKIVPSPLCDRMPQHND